MFSEHNVLPNEEKANTMRCAKCEPAHDLLIRIEAEREKYKKKKSNCCGWFELWWSLINADLLFCTARSDWTLGRLGTDHWHSLADGWLISERAIISSSSAASPENLCQATKRTRSIWLSNGPKIQATAALTAAIVVVIRLKIFFCDRWR